VKLEVHHVIPFQVDSSLELVPSNFVVLCEGKKTINCHLIVGHGGDYKDFNPSVLVDAEHMRVLFSERQFAKCLSVKGGV